MQRVEHNGATVLLDSYNASPDSMVAAIEAVAELPCSGRRLAVLGTMRELGDYSESGHRRVGAALGAHPLDAVLLVGAETAAVADEALAAGVPRDSIQTMEQVDLSRVRAFLDTVRQGDVAIVKASRSLALEEALCLPSS
jgi:UDP-N-acetylmuramoyl-tripeptide--D-alanyl-D-alanine ligase